jgi:hypothetical protein
MSVNFREGAELYHPLHKREVSRLTPITYKRFRTASAAIRFAVEELPEALFPGALLEVGEKRFNAKEIRRLYRSNRYPFRRRKRGERTPAF